MNSRLEQQINFILEIDKLKAILRQTPITVSERRVENSAEHSWHIAIMATLLVEYAPAPVDVSRAVGMLLVHDIIEIDAGDTFAYDTEGYSDKEDRERLAADRLFGLLPPAQAAEFRSLWDEFEAISTPESRYANALDRLQPLLLNSRTGGGSWRHHQVSRDKVLTRMEPIRTTLPDVWPFVMAIIDDATSQGWLT